MRRRATWGVLALLLAVGLAVLWRAPVGAQEPVFPFRVFECGSICPDCRVPGELGNYTEIFHQGGRFVFEAERSTPGCCTYNYYRICETRPLTPYTLYYEQRSVNNGWSVNNVLVIPYTDDRFCDFGGGNTGDKTCSGTITRVTQDDTSAGGYVGLVLDGSSYASVELFVPGFEIPIYCPDGIELLESGPVTLLPNEFIHTTAITTTPTVQFRYTLLTTGTETLAGAVTLQNDPAVWNYPFTHISPTEVISTVVPPYQGVPLMRVFSDDYMAYFQMDNTGDEAFTVASICMIPPDQIPIPTCPGVEALPEQYHPFTVRAGLGSWQSGAVETSYGEFKTTFWIEQLGPLAGGTLTANRHRYQFQRSAGASPLISITVPISGGIVGPTASLGVVNTGVYDFKLHSACIEPLTQTRQCNIINYDFTQGEAPWVTFPGSQTWLGESMEVEGIMYGKFITDTRIMGNYRYEARVRAAGSSSDVKLWLQMPQHDYATVEVSRTVGSAWTVMGFSAWVYDPNKPIVQAENGAAEVDWVCIYKITDLTRFPVPVCSAVTFDDSPGGLADLLDVWYWLHWIARKVRDIAEWVVCMIWRILTMIANTILDALERLGIEPPLVGEWDFSAWVAWILEVLTALSNWANVNLQNGQLTLQNILQWLVTGIIRPILQWLLTLAVGNIEAFADWILSHVSALLGLERSLSVRALIRDAQLFWKAVQFELGLEIESTFLLLEQVGDVFGVLITGYREGLAGDLEADFGESLGGLAAYLWRGVRWVDESIQGTPLTALSLIARGIIAWGLAQFTLERFSKLIGKIGDLIPSS